MQVTTSSRNYNYLALRGANVDDMEFIEQFGLDPSIAYTNKLNEAMLDKTEKDNIQSFMDEGMDAESAAVKAAQNKEQAWKDLKILLAKNGMLK